jgi:hypothetical protein
MFLPSLANLCGVFMRFVCLVALLFISLGAAAKGPERLNFREFSATRSESAAFAIKLEIAGRKLDAFLASEEAKQFGNDPDAMEDLPIAVMTIFSELGFAGDDELVEGKFANAAGSLLFKLCDGENAALTRVRAAWSERIFALGVISMRAEEEIELTPAQANQAHQLLQPVLTGFIDSWITTAGNYVGCTQQAINFAEFASADHSNRFAKAMLGMTQSGLLLALADGNENRVAEALRKREQSLAKFLIEANRMFLELQALNPTASAEMGDTVAEMLEPFTNYDTEFKRVTARRLSPVWRADLQAPAKIHVIRRLTCGFGTGFADLFTVLIAPNWPSATAVLQARDAHEAAAAYALAALFNTTNKLSAINSMPLAVRQGMDERDIVWRAYGKAETAAEMQRAAASIELTAAQNGLAIVRIFGHEFLLTSGTEDTVKTNSSPIQTQWYTRAEIIDAFRASSEFRALSGLE